MSLKNLLTAIAHRGETGFDRVKQALGDRLQLDGRPHIHPYLGYGSAEFVWIMGRVLRSRPAALPEADDSLLDNLWRTYQLIESDEVPGARIQIHGFGASQVVTADEEGYFHVELRPAILPEAVAGWHEVALELLDEPDLAPASGRVLLPPAAAGFGVISDIDDTIIHSSATRLLEAVRLMFLENAATRLPFPGVAAFYEGLRRGSGRYPGPNPIFYVSSSPWNLFPMLTDFMAFNDIPLGPLFLQDYGIDADRFITGGHRDHKRQQIDRLLAAFPQLPFILIGDSGQKDPEIYREVVHDYPGRILAVYIRDVTGDRRDAAVHTIAADLQTQGVDLLLTEDTAGATQHAEAKGFVVGGEQGTGNGEQPS